MRRSAFIASFLKIGLLGFGGGSALLPLMERELVGTKKMLSAADFHDYVIVGNITPGAFPVKLAAACGSQLFGIPGLLAAAYAFAAPGVFLTVLLLSSLQTGGRGFLSQVEYASVGISAFIIFLLLRYIAHVLRDAKKHGFAGRALLLTALSFLFTCGKEWRCLIDRFAGRLAAPAEAWLDIRTVDLLFLSFFVIFFSGGRWRKYRCAAAFLFVIAFLGDCAAGGRFRLLLMAAMTLAAAAAARHDIRRELRGAPTPAAPPGLLRACRQALALAAPLPPLFFLLACFSGFPAALEYLGGGFASTVTSFGGGEAYLTVAEGIFISAGFIPAEAFYGQILPAANTLPGPILLKVLSGIGYIWGVRLGGQPLGWLAALFGLVLGVAASGFVFAFAYALYHRFSSLMIFRTLREWILPIICGLLLSTLLSLCNEMLRISLAAGLPAASALLLACGILLACVLLHKCLRFHDIALIAASLGASLFIINCFA